MPSTDPPTKLCLTIEVGPSANPDHRFSAKTQYWPEPGLVNEPWEYGFGNTQEEAIQQSMGDMLKRLKVKDPDPRPYQFVPAVELEAIYVSLIEETAQDELDEKVIEAIEDECAHRGINYTEDWS